MADDNKTDFIFNVIWDGDDVEDGLRKTKRSIDSMNKVNAANQKKAHKQIVDTQKVKEKSEGTGALRKMEQSLRKQLNLRKQVTQEMKQQLRLASRIMGGGPNMLQGGPIMSMFGGPNRFGRGGMSMSSLFRGGRGMIGGLGRMGMGAMKMLGPLAPLLAIAGMGFNFASGATMSKIQAGHSMRMTEARSLGRMSGLGTSATAMYQRQRIGAELGFDPLDTLQQARGVAMQTGNARAVTTAQAYSRLTGMDVGQTGGVMGAMARGGNGFTVTGSGTGDRAMERLFAGATASGLDKSRFHEVFTGMSRLIGQIAPRVAGRVQTGGMSDLLGFMGMSGKAGLQGERAINLLAKLDAGIRNPGGGEHGEALMMQAMGFGKPGGQTSYYDAQKMMQKGLSDPENLVRIFGETAGQTQGGEEQIMALSKLFNVDYEPLEELRKVVGDFGGKSQEERQKAIQEWMEKNGSVEEKALMETKKMSHELPIMSKHLLDTLEIGRKFSDTLLNIESTTNLLVRRMIPLFEGLYSILDGVYRVVVNKWGTTEDKEHYNRQSIGELREKLHRGDISRADFNTEMEKLGGSDLVHANIPHTVTNKVKQWLESTDKEASEHFSFDEEAMRRTNPALLAKLEKARSLREQYRDARKSQGRDDDYSVLAKLQQQENAALLNELIQWAKSTAMSTARAADGIENNGPTEASFTAPAYDNVNMSQ